MILQQYGITLKRVEVEDIELIRQHRNSKEIRKYMEYKKYISTVKQQKWFESINNPENYYFLILTKEKPVGVINAKNINWKDKYGEGGIFIWDKECQNTEVVFLSSLILLNFCFNILSFDLSYIKVLSTNQRAISYNLALGYRLVPYQEKHNNKLYILTSERFISRLKRLQNTLHKIHQNQCDLKIIGHKKPNNHALVNRLLD